MFDSLMFNLNLFIKKQIIDCMGTIENLRHSNHDKLIYIISIVILMTCTSMQQLISEFFTYFLFYFQQSMKRHQEVPGV